MKRFLTTALAVLLLFLLPGYAAAPAVDKAHAASHHIAQAVISGKAYCSATAIGPQALLTATHCELPSDDLLIQGVDDDVTIVARIRDGNDHTIYLVKGTTFADYVAVNLAEPAVADDVFTFGNPGQWNDVYQRGYVAKVQHHPANIFSDGAPDDILLSLQAYPGISGAGIFNVSGQLVAVESQAVYQVDDNDHAVEIAFSDAIALGFSQADVDRARAWVAPVDPPAAKK